MRRRLAVQCAVLLAVGGAAYGIGGVADGGPPEGELIVVQDVPSDVRAELDVTWQRFLDRFGSRRTCWTDVSVVLVADVVDGDARYVTADARIEIEIPTTPARFRESLAHELAHHVEHTCVEFETLESRLLPALGGGDWFAGETWDQVPSERFAEAVVELVNGERIRHAERVQVDPAVVAAISEWGAGAPAGT